MNTHLNFVAYSLLFLALIHAIFPKYFNWEKELSSLSPINKEMMQVHTFFIALVVFLMGILCVFCQEDLLYTSFGHKISLGLSIFWGIRLFFQLFVYSPSLWKGKRFETIVHILFTIYWSYLTYLFYIITSITICNA